MNLDSLRSSLQQQLIEQANRLELNRDTIELNYVLNWGGFVNASFTATDGRKTFHIKVSQSQESDESLRRWCNVHRPLEQKYHAPKILLNMQLHETDREVIVFEQIRGEPPKALTRTLSDKILSVLQRLHSDSGLAREIDGGRRSERSYADCYKATFHDRFTEDLAIIESNLPPFVDRKCFDWMQFQAEHLLQSVESSTAFQNTTRHLAHGDLWLNNILVDGEENFWILDWDDLAVSDPALDLVMLLGPSVEDIQPFEITKQKVPSYPIDECMEERLELYAPARLLDWVIDPLADYIEAESAPAVADEVRRKNQHFHALARTAYESRYAFTS
ncbi:MAG: aminoglycoside phosphotransferase family protein [Cyanobacteria bacterium SZAS LIN-5]|nr:aminoglycoside phosphotransferase family protein [Cyanobacteria bacterium SZAS LIN-5]